MYALTDERGHLLHGNHPSSPLFSIPYVEGDLVYVMQCDNGIFPPNTDGTPNLQNPILFISRIGSGIAPIFEQPAKFSDAVIPRPVGDVFVRVFNAPTLAEASFYADSHVHTVIYNSDIFRIESHRTSKPIDPGDDDDDGLNNSWEISYGTDADDADSDGDGLMDGLEHMAGLDPMDSDSNLAMSRVVRQGDDLCIEWTSVTGATYRVEALSPETSTDHYIPVATGIQASNYTTCATLPLDVYASLRCFRVIRDD